MRDNPDLTARPEAPLQQPTTIGTVVALLPDDLHGRSRSSEGAGFGEGTPAAANSNTERLGQQRESWNLFSLPSFRLSNSLILAQVFVRRPSVPRQGPPPSRLAENEESSSSGVNDRLSPAVNDRPSPAVADVVEIPRQPMHVDDESTGNPSGSAKLMDSSTARELLDAVSELPETSHAAPKHETSSQDSLVEDDGAVHNLHDMGDARDEDKLSMFPVDATSPDSEAQYYLQQDNVNSAVRNTQATDHASQLHVTSGVTTDMNEELNSAAAEDSRCLFHADERLGLVFHSQDPPSATVPANQDFDSANHAIRDPVSMVSSNPDSDGSFDQDLGHVAEMSPRTSCNNADVTSFGDLTGD